MSLLRPLTIGDVTLPNNLVLSPMAGFSDLPFRVLCRRHRAGLVCSEMVAATSVERDDPHARARMRTAAEEAPMSIQLFGTDPVSIAEAAKEAQRRCVILGFNMGCPAHQIKRQGCGAALLDHPDLAEEIVRAIKGASRLPLLVKMRAGNHRWMDSVAFARRLEHAGADAILFHARTAEMGYSGRSDWDLIRRVKESISIPVVGNGDVVDGPTAERALRESGVDGIAIGRASLGDPRIFARIASHLETGREAPVASLEERAADFLEYARMAGSCGIERTRILQQAHQFTRGLKGAARLRERLAGRPSTDEILGVFEALAAGARSGATA